MILRTTYIVAAFALGLTSLWFATDGLRAITAESARRVAIADNPQPVPQVLLETMQGDWQSLPGTSPALVEFIYTTCPTICQTSGGDFAELRDHLRSKGVTIRMYSVSFDPENDDLHAMQHYAKLHKATGSPWTIARPLKKDLPSLLKKFRITIIPDQWGGYQHNIAVLLINKKGEFAGAFDTRAFDEIHDAIKADSL